MSLRQAIVPPTTGNLIACLATGGETWRIAFRRLNRADHIRLLHESRLKSDRCRFLPDIGHFHIESSALALELFSFKLLFRHQKNLIFLDYLSHVLLVAKIDRIKNTPSFA